MTLPKSTFFNPEKEKMHSLECPTRVFRIHNGNFQHSLRRTRRSWSWMFIILSLNLSSLIIVSSCLPEGRFSSMEQNMTDDKSTVQAVVSSHRRHPHSSHHQRIQLREQSEEYTHQDQDQSEEIDDGFQSPDNFSSMPDDDGTGLTPASNKTTNLIADLDSTLDELNTPDGYWIRVAQAKTLALALKHETLPRLDEMSQIMKPAACRDDDASCKDFVQCANGAKFEEEYMDLLRMRNGCNSSVDEIPYYMNKIWSYCNMEAPTEAGFLWAPADAPQPVPIFHCNTHLSRTDEHRNFQTNFRMEYPGTVSPPEDISNDLIPRYFVIEKQQRGKWNIHGVQQYWLFRFDTKLHETFRLRVTAVTPKYVFPPVMSPPVTLYESAIQTISKPVNLTAVNITLDDGAARPSPSALLRWNSGSGFNASCDFDVYYMDDDEMGKVERTKGDDAFWVKLNQLGFEKNYIITVYEKFGGNRESDIEINLRIPSCLEMRGYSFTLCRPPPPSKVRLVNATETSFWLKWEPPKYTNATNRILRYNITVDWIYTPSAVDGIIHSTAAPYSTHRVFSGSVPDNVTQIEIKNVKALPGKYKVYVVAISSSGSSDPSLDFVYYKGPTLSTWSVQKIITLFFALFGVVVLVGLFCLLKHFHERRQRKKKRQEKFENYEKESFQLSQIDRDSSKWEIDCCSIKLGDAIGQGYFGLVRRATLVRKGIKTTVAVKTLRDDVDDKDVGKFWEEFEILKNLDSHTHIVGLKGIVTKHVPLPLLVVEYCDGGDLQSHLRKAFKSNGCGRKYSPGSTLSCGSSLNTNSNSENRVQIRLVTNETYFIKPEAEIPEPSMGDLLCYARQIACGMEYLSTNKIVHRDLAARNILISGKPRILKIADFGLSRDVYEQNLYKKSSKGNIPFKWLAVESLLQEIYTTESDVWSYGILLWEIFTYGGTPYPGVENKKIFDLLKIGYRMPKPEHCPLDLYELMRSCWEDEPIVRPSFTTIRFTLEDIMVKTSQVTYLNLESGIGSYDGSYSTNEPELPPRRKPLLSPLQITCQERKSS